MLEALAFGWIDSVVKRVNDEYYVQRFSPRKPTSILSQMNKERIRELVREGKMTNAGLTALAHVYNPDTDKKEKLVIPREYSTRLKKILPSGLTF